MPKLKCELCGRVENFTLDQDLWTCPKCKMEQPTGLESSIRSRVEGYRKVTIPTLTVGRAIGFAAGIYELSTHNERIDVSGIESRLRKKTGIDTGFEHSSIRKWEHRQNDFMGVTLTDKGVGVLIYLLSGVIEQREWNTAFIVFRGSRGAKQGNDNLTGAGWGQVGEGSHNLDWGTNFNTAQVPAPWATNVKIHQGFLQMYSSVRETIHGEVKRLCSQSLRNLQFVCTGHSLGAGLATICAHDLQNSLPIEPLCYPFCSPKTGNLAFARDFEVKLAQSQKSIAAEPGTGLYHRGITFVQGNDPVSWGGKHGFAVSKSFYKDSYVKSGEDGSFTSGKNAFLSGYGHLRTGGQKVADTGSTVKQLLWTVPQRKSETAIYYLAPLVYRASITGLHAYTRMESELLGKRG